MSITTKTNWTAGEVITEKVIERWEHNISHLELLCREIENITSKLEMDEFTGLENDITTLRELVYKASVSVTRLDEDNQHLQEQGFPIMVNEIERSERVIKETHEKLDELIEVLSEIEYIGTIEPRNREAVIIDFDIGNYQSASIYEDYLGIAPIIITAGVYNMELDFQLFGECDKFELYLGGFVDGGRKFIPLIKKNKDSGELKGSNEIRYQLTDIIDLTEFSPMMELWVKGEDNVTIRGHFILKEVGGGTENVDS